MIARFFLTIFGLSALIGFGVVQTDRANRSASRQASETKPNEHFKQPYKDAGASENQSDNTSQIVGAATLIVLIGQSWIFARQANLMRRTVDIYERQASLMSGQLQAAVDAANAAKANADAAADQVAIARKTLTEGRRPYILVEATKSSVPLVMTGYGRTLSFSYAVTNHGAGVALVTSYRDVIIIKQNLPDESDLEGVAFEMSDDIIKSSNSIDREIIDSKGKIDAEAFIMLQSNTTRAFIMGQIVYEDIFYENYVTKFCFEGGVTERPMATGGMDLNARS